MAGALDGALAERSRELLGLVTIAQLDALGVSRQQRRTLLVHGVLVPVHRGVFRHVAHPVTWQQSVLAGVLVAGDQAVASHVTAARLWRFDGFRASPARRVEAGVEVEITVPRVQRPRSRPGLVVHRSADLGVADREVRRLVPSTTAARTLCDISARLTTRRLEAVLDDAERRGLVWRPHLRWRIAELHRRGRSGVPQLEHLLDRTEGRPLGDSWLEQEALRIITRAELPTPRCQVRLRKVGGRIARVDLFWQPERLVVELDGHATHATRRQRQADAERAARLSLAGWRMVRFTYEDVVERPDHVVEMIRISLLAVPA